MVDMQNDFITGSLGTEEAEAIIPLVAEKLTRFDRNGLLIATMDKHNKALYSQSQEGRLLPVLHCVEGEWGAQMPKPIMEAFTGFPGDRYVFAKSEFGSVDLAMYLAELNTKDTIEEIELIGLCTDVCVVSNALLLKAFLPEVPIAVDASCCAGTTPENHAAALRTMRSCQIEIRNDESVVAR